LLSDSKAAAKKICCLKKSFEKKWMAVKAKREGDLKNYRKAKEAFRSWYKKMNFLESEIKAGEELNRMQG